MDTEKYLNQLREKFPDVSWMLRQEQWFHAHESKAGPLEWECVAVKGGMCKGGRHANPRSAIADCKLEARKAGMIK